MYIAGLKYVMINCLHRYAATHALYQVNDLRVVTNGFRGTAGVQHRPKILGRPWKFDPNSPYV